MNMPTGYMATFAEIAIVLRLGQTNFRFPSICYLVPFSAFLWWQKIGIFPISLIPLDIIPLVSVETKGSSESENVIRQIRHFCLTTVRLYTASSRGSGKVVCFFYLPKKIFGRKLGSG